MCFVAVNACILLLVTVTVYEMESHVQEEQVQTDTSGYLAIYCRFCLEDE